MNETYAPRSPDLSALHSNASNAPHTVPTPPYSAHLTPSHPHQTFGTTTPPFYNHKEELATFPHDTQNLPPAGVPSYVADWPQNSSYQQQYPSDPRFKPYTMPRGRKAAQGDAEWLPQNQQYGLEYNSTTSFGAPLQTSEPPPKPPPGTEEGIIVKTKFPVARIKRIVQADEDVGKVAQSTPVAVSKALELFMISLALGSAQVAREKGSKKVSGQHLKAAVARDEQFDFLNEIVAKIGDAGAGKDGAKEKKGRDASSSEDRGGDDSEDEEYGKPRRRRPAASTAKRRKKEEDD